MKRIGIITWYYNCYNYGGLLQAYALTRVLNDMGFEAKQILANVVNKRARCLNEMNSNFGRGECYEIKYLLYSGRRNWT